MNAKRADVMRQLGERLPPLPACLNRLRAGVGERGLRDQQVDDAAYAFAISSESHLLRLLSTREEIGSRADAARRRLESGIRSQNLQSDLLAHLLRSRRGGHQLVARLARSILVREPGEDRQLQT